MKNAASVLLCGLLLIDGAMAEDKDVDVFRATEEDEAAIRRYKEELKRTKASFLHLKQLVSDLGKSDEFTLYETTAFRESGEAKGAQVEAGEKGIERFGFPFRAVSKKVSDDDYEELLSLIQDPETFEEYGGGRGCEYFPGFALVWLKGSVKLEIHICFTCHEVKVYDKEIRVHCDIQDGGYKKLRELLERYQS